MFSLLKYFRWFIIGGLVLSSLVCSVHAGSTINLDLQAIPPSTLLPPPAAKKAPSILVAGMGGSGGSGASGAGTTSKPAGQAGNGYTEKFIGIATHQLSFVTLNDKGDEREEENDPPPTKKAQPESAAPISCRWCQNTLNEQEVSRILRGSTAEPVLCDACLHSLAQAPQSAGKGKAAGKRARPAQAEGRHMPLWDYTIQPQAAREAPSEKRTGKRKQDSHPQSEPSAKRLRLKITSDQC